MITNPQPLNDKKKYNLGFTLQYTLKIFLTLLISSSTFTFSTTEDELNNRYNRSSLAVMDFSYLRDTVYTLKPYFIEVNLATQKGYLYSRTDSVNEFGISSGTSRILDGVNTKEGLFVIQSKMPKWYSQQFDSTLMLNWLGFNYGIGFHALLGNTYYRYLGVKKSSHGCLRVSREMAKELYSKIELGTPVLVHSGNNTVFVGFGDSSDVFSYYTFEELPKILHERYSVLYNGEYFLNQREKFLIDRNNVKHSGLPIGNSNKIPKRQIVLPLSLYISSAIPEEKKLMMIERIENSTKFTLKEINVSLTE